MPGAVEHSEVAGRRSRAVGDARTRHRGRQPDARQLLAGRWEVVERAGHRARGRRERRRPDGEYVLHPLAVLQRDRGAVGAGCGRRSRRDQRMARQRRAETPPLRGRRGTLALAEDGRRRRSSSLASPRREATRRRARSSEGLRIAWPAALDGGRGSSLAGGRLRLVGLFDQRRRGHIPPYLRAHLAAGPRPARRRARRARRPSSAELGAAVEGFGALGYPLLAGPRARRTSPPGCIDAGPGRGGDAAARGGDRDVRAARRRSGAGAGAGAGGRQIAFSSSVISRPTPLASPKSIAVFGVVEERVVDPREARVHRALEDDHRAALVDVEDRHAVDRASRACRARRGWSRRWRR